MQKFFTVEEVIEELGYFDILNLSSDVKERRITNSELNRPGLALSGFFERFDETRVQVIGNVESEFLANMTEDALKKSIEDLFSRDIPAVIITSGNKVYDEIKIAAKKYDITILKAEQKTSRVISDYYNFAERRLAPHISVHGVLVEIYGLGVLIKGKSGIGKSETALDLITRGHRLVSDDIVDITNIGNDLIGQSPSVTRHFMEIRGVGILNIERLYGASSVKSDQEINLVINLENWDEEKDYDRLGLDTSYENILGVDVKTVSIPMRPGRNTAMVIEVASRNETLKSLGYSAVEELTTRIEGKIEDRKNKNNK